MVAAYLVPVKYIRYILCIPRYLYSIILTNGPKTLLKPYIIVYKRYRRCKYR